MDGSIKHVISVSGGKDSTATLLLARERGVEFEAVFADTGNEHPQTYDYLDHLEDRLDIVIRDVVADFKMRIANKREFIVAKWSADGVSDEHIAEALDILIPTGNPFLDLCLWKGRFPSPKARFCTQELKVLPLINKVFLPYSSQFDEVWSWQGIRADESAARADMPPVEVGDFPNSIIYRPILNWTADDVFAMHKRHDVKPNPLYTQGMGRVGCMPCIMARKGELAEIQKRFPEELDRIYRWEQLVSRAAKRGSATFLTTAVPIRVLDDDEVHYKTHGIPFWREYALTKRGGGEIAPEHEGDVPVCASQYGLCE